MKTRCYNRKRPEWKRYGGRGIKVAARWLASYQAFLADMGVCPEGHSLDRKNNDRDYRPGNCRWADRATQARNRSTTKLSTRRVAAAKRRAKNGESFAAIARSMDVHRSAISRAVGGLRWGTANAHV